MKAMILAAGIGSRLGSLTSDKPKALVPFQGKPLLEIIIQRLKFAGFNEIVINVHHFAEQIIEYLDHHHVDGVEIMVSHEKKLLDTGGGIRNALKLLGNHPVLFYNVDILTELDLKAFYKHHIDSGAKVSLAVKDRPTSRQLLFTPKGILAGWSYPDRKLKIISRESRKGYVQTGFSGIYIINPEVLRQMPDDDVFSITPWLIELSRDIEIGSYDHSDGKWFDLGRKNSFVKAEAKILLSEDGSPELKRKPK